MDVDFRFDRAVSEELMDALLHGPANDLVKLVKNQRGTPLYDLQLRREVKPKNPKSWATLYYGMTALLNLSEHKGDRFRLTADKSYMALDEFDDTWKGWQPREAIEQAWPRVARYLEAVKGVVDPKHTSKEGAVHASIGAGGSDAYRVINREASPSFRDTPTRTRRRSGWAAALNAALHDDPEAGQPWWPKDVKVGSSLDFLAVDIGGRLALIEAKADSASAKELAKVAVQVGVYAAMYADLLREDSLSTEAIPRMLSQRTRLGLSRKGMLHLREEGRVVPVVAIGPGKPSTEVHRRMWKVAIAVARAHGDKVDPVEVWYLDAHGRITEVEREEDVRRG